MTRLQQETHHPGDPVIVELSAVNFQLKQPGDDVDPRVHLPAPALDDPVDIGVDRVVGAGVTLGLARAPRFHHLGRPALEKLQSSEGKPSNAHSTSAGIGTATVGTRSHSCAAIAASMS